MLRPIRSAHAREATARYLNECQDLLLNLVRAEKNCEGDKHDLSLEVERARELLRHKRMLDVELRAPEVARARELLERHQPAFGVQSSGAPRFETPVQAVRMKPGLRNDLRGWEWRYLRGLWKSDELATLKSRSENSKWILVVDFSPDGRLLAAASQDGKVTLWSIQDRRKVGELKSGKFRPVKNGIRSNCC